MTKTHGLDFFIGWFKSVSNFFPFSRILKSFSIEFVFKLLVTER